MLEKQPYCLFLKYIGVIIIIDNYKTMQNKKKLCEPSTPFYMHSETFLLESFILLTNDIDSDILFDMAETNLSYMLSLTGPLPSTPTSGLHNL